MSIDNRRDALLEDSKQSEFLEPLPIHTNNYRIALEECQSNNHEVFFYCGRPDLKYSGIHTVFFSDMQRKSAIRITHDSFKASEKEFHCLRKTGSFLKQRSYQYAIQDPDSGFAWLNFYSYVTRNDDALCWCHEHEVERYVNNNPNLFFDRYDLNNQVIEYVRDGDRIFVKAYLKASLSNPFFLRIQIGRYRISRTDYPDLFEKCHANIESMWVAVSLNPSKYALNISANVLDKDGHVCEIISYVAPFPKMECDIYFNFDLLSPKALLTEINALYLTQDGISEI